jgi:hypothetical protein
VSVVIALRRVRVGTRVVDEIGLLDRAGDTLAVYPAWTRTGGVAGAARRLGDELAAHEARVPELLL